MLRSKIIITILGLLLSCIGYAQTKINLATQVKGILAIANGGTGQSTGLNCSNILDASVLCNTIPASGIQAWLTAPTSANLAAAVTDETGTGALVFAGSPTFTTLINAPVVVNGIGASNTLLIQATRASNPNSSSMINFAVGNTGATIYAQMQSNTGHWVYGGVTPTLSSCGTGASIVGNDLVFVVTPGTGAIGCTINFNKTWSANPPVCTVSAETLSLVNALSYTISTTQLILTQASITGNFDVHCLGRL